MLRPGILGNATLALFVLAALGACSSVPKRPAAEGAQEVQRHLRAGIAAAHAGQHELALAEYVKGLNQEGKNAELHYRAALSQAALGKLPAAATAYRHALTLAPDHAGAHEGLGLLLLRQADHAGARRLLERAVALKPDAWRSLNGLGALADLRRDPAAADDYYTRALAINPNAPVLLNNFGYSKYLAGKLDVARALFERAAAIDPGYGQAWRNLGLVHARNTQYAEAMRAFGQSMSEAEAAYTTGYVCMLENRPADAERLFRRAIDLSPAYYADAQDALARVKVMRSEPATSLRP
ncbi:MAG: tetratricopeptide repeat protein [Pseudomonadota bacterium]